MKKENIQSRNRKLSAKARKKHSSFAPVADMLKPLEKMYGYAGMAAAGMGGMSSYYMPHAAAMPTMPGAAAAAASGAAAGTCGPAGATSTPTSQYGMHMMAASQAALGGFGAAPTAFGGMVSTALRTTTPGENNKLNEREKEEKRSKELATCLTQSISRLGVMLLQEERKEEEELVS